MKALKECHSDIIEIYGYGVQVITALSTWHGWLRNQISSGKTKKSNRMFFSADEEDPNRPEAKYQYQRDVGHLLDVAAKEGPLSVLHRRSVVTLLYSTWEDRHRAMMATEIGLKSKDDLKSDVFKDVNVYRRAIIHAGGKLQDKPKVFCFFEKGEEVSLTQKHIDLIFRHVVEELNRIGREHYGTDPQFSFDKQLNAP